jgi:hypothetical protein
MRFHLATLLFIGLPLTACAGQSSDSDLSPWISVLANPQITVLLDSSRIAATARGLDVWVRFEHREPELAPGGEDYFTRMDAHAELDCRSSLVRDIALVIFDSAGVQIGETDFGSQSGSTRWRLFAEHPFSEHLFLPLCRRLEQIRPLSGAPVDGADAPRSSP